MWGKSAALGYLFFICWYAGSLFHLLSSNCILSSLRVSLCSLTNRLCTPGLLNNSCTIFCICSVGALWLTFTGWKPEWGQLVGALVVRLASATKLLLIHLAFYSVIDLACVCSVHLSYIKHRENKGKKKENAHKKKHREGMRDWGERAVNSLSSVLHLILSVAAENKGFALT